MTDVQRVVRPEKATKVDPRDIQQLQESPVQWSRVARMFRPFVRQLTIVTLIIVVSSLVALAQPFLVRTVIDDALPLGDQRLLILTVVGMVAVAAVSGVLGVLQTWLATSIGQKVMHQLRIDVFSHLQAQSMDFFKRTRGGEIQSRLTNDIAGMRAVITSTATTIAANLTTVVATASAMFALNWRLSLLTALVLPPAVWSTRRVAMVRKSLTAQRQRQMADLQSHVMESLSVSGAQLVKTLGVGSRRLNDFTAASRDLIDLELRAELAGRWRMTTMQIVFAAIPAIIYLAAGFPQTAQGVTIGTLVAFTTLQTAIFRPLMGLLNIGAQWVAAMALLSRIFGYLDLPVGVPAPAKARDIDLSSVRGEVRFEGVSYSFQDSHEPALKNIDLVIEPGRSLGVVGETGSGKSTLAGLLARLADPSSGRVTIDGIDVRQFRTADLTRIVGVVSQETYLVHDTILANLLLAKEDATEEEVWQSLEVAQVDQVVRKLPDGLATVVGSRGHRFSGGERQRIAIARTILRDPQILILDEATSALDNDTERELQMALRQLSEGRTTLTVAHRLSTIGDADEVVVLDAGEIVETGTFSDLLASGGRLARMVASGADEVSDDNGKASYVGRHSKGTA